MVRTKRGEQTRAVLVDAARDHLLDAGLDSFSLREVARRADLAPSAVYNHFPDKDRLIMALGMESVQTLSSFLVSVPAQPAGARLMELARAYVRFATEHPAEYRVIFDCLVNPPHTWSDYVRLAHPFSIIVGCCEQGISEGLFDASEVEASRIAYGLWALVAGHVNLREKHLAAVDGPFEDMLEASIEALIEGYASAKCSTGADRGRVQRHERDGHDNTKEQLR